MMMMVVVVMLIVLVMGRKLNGMQLCECFTFNFSKHISLYVCVYMHFLIAVN